MAGFGFMDVTDLITPHQVIAKLRVASKKQALQELAHRAAGIVSLPERAIYDILVERERLGTTGVGAGIAIPHGKLPGLNHLTGLFVQLDNPIDFTAIDDQPLDLIFLLLPPPSPDPDHLTP